MLVDSHCHLDFPDFQQRLSEVLKTAAEHGIGRMVNISTYVAKYDLYRAIAEAHDQVFFTIGTHPHNAGMEPDTKAEHLVRLAAHPRCIGIGEAGLDYFYDKSPRDVQQKVFRTHIEAARESGLPLVIHARNADDDMIMILEEEMRRGRFDAILHCFSSGQRLADAGLALGLHVSFSGILTFKKSDDIRQIAASVPMSRLLVETDAPYLAPEPYRGKTNEPAYVSYTARTLARVMNVSEEEIARVTTDNFYRLFHKAAELDKVEPAA